MLGTNATTRGEAIREFAEQCPEHPWIAQLAANVIAIDEYDATAHDTESRLFETGEIHPMDDYDWNADKVRQLIGNRPEQLFRAKLLQGGQGTRISFGKHGIRIDNNTVDGTYNVGIFR